MDAIKAACQTFISGPLREGFVDVLAMFFHSPDLDLERAVPGTLVVTPSSRMLEPLRRDYDAMKGMTLAAAPAFDEVVAAVAALENSTQ